MPPPAAPRTVLCESEANLKSNTLSSRNLPTGGFPLDIAENFKRLLLRLLLLSRDKWHDIVHDIERSNTRIPCPGERLQGRDDELLHLVARLHEGIDGRQIALERTIRLHDDKTFFPAIRLLLRRNDVEMLRVYLGNKHRDVLRAAMRRGVGKYRHPRGSVLVLILSDELFFRHLEGRENERARGGGFCDIAYVLDHEMCNTLRQTTSDKPSIAQRIFIFLSRRLRRSGDVHHLEPRMILQ